MRELAEGVHWLLIAVPSGAIADALGKSFATHVRDLAPSEWGAKEA